MTNNFIEIETPKTHKLREYLETLSGTIRTGEVFWEFETRLFEYDGSFRDVKDVIRFAYPEAKVDLAEIREGSPDDLRITLESELGRFLPHLISTYIEGVWALLKNCIDYEDARIFEYFTREHIDLVGGIA